MTDSGDDSLQRQLLLPLDDLSPEELSEWLERHRHRLSDIELGTISGDYPGTISGDYLVASALMLGLSLDYRTPELSSTSEIIREYWRTFAGGGEHLLIAARAARNLWNVRDGQNPISHEVRAVDLFRQIGNDSGASATARAGAVSEAIELAAGANRKDQLGDLIDLALQLLDEFEGCWPGHDPACVDKHQAQLRTGPEGARDLISGLREDAVAEYERRFHDAALSLLRTLSDLLGGRHSDLVDRADLSERANRFAQEVQSSDELTERVRSVLIALAVDPEERKTVQREWIKRERSRVADSEDPIRWGTYQKLEKLARAEGLTSLAKDLQVEMQNIDVSAALNRERFTWALPEEVTAAATRRVAEICDHASVSEALDAFVTLGFEYSQSVVEHNLPETPVSDLLSAVRIGHESAAARIISPVSEPDGTATSDPVASENRQAGAYMRSLHLHAALVAVPALDRIFERFRDSIVDELVARAEAFGLVDEVRAHRAAEAVVRWEREWDAAAHSLSPRVEYAIRQVAKAHQISVLQNTDGTCRGGHTSLNQVLAALNGRMPDDVRQHLDWVLVSDLGANLRNDISHGDRPEIDKASAAMLIHAYLLTLYTFSLSALNRDEEE